MLRLAQENPGRADLAEDCPRDLEVRHEPRDDDNHVITAYRAVAQRLPIHVNDEAFAYAGTGSPVAAISIPELSIATCP